MVKVITYGTYDMLHFGHLRLLERAKTLGDYLIVGVTSDDYDRTRGKINNQQSLMERIEAIKQTGLADEIIVEEYEGQKIDDIKRFGVDIFTVGSDWVGKFDYLKEYCQVIYLPRTEGVSSTMIRADHRKLRLGIVGSSGVIPKFIREANCVNGVQISGLMPEEQLAFPVPEGIQLVESYEALLACSDAVYVISMPERHHDHIRQAILQGKHVLCESPVALRKADCEELFSLARERGCILMDGIKTVYSTAYSRLALLVKSGKIGRIVSVDAVCTSLMTTQDDLDRKWNSICAWGPIAMLPVFDILGCNYLKKTVATHFLDRDLHFDGFTKIDFQYPSAVASVKVAKAAKSEGTLVITGTKGYLYVPAPWWKTDYFEVRFENATENRRFFYQLDGEGIRYEIVAFTKTIETKKDLNYLSPAISREIAGTIEAVYSGEDLNEI